ncbi:hypothetical protein PRBEI_2000962500 [Prionailurus iriomotensis]
MRPLRQLVICWTCGATDGTKPIFIPNGEKFCGPFPPPTIVKLEEHR